MKTKTILFLALLILFSYRTAVILAVGPQGKPQGQSPGTQKPEPKITEKLEDSNKYGDGGKVQTASDDKYLVVYQVWYDKNKKQREVYTPRHYDHATKIYYQQWEFYEPGNSATLVTIQYDPSAGTFTVDGKGKTTSKTANPSQAEAWVAQFEKRFAEDGTISAPWDEVATTAEQPTHPPTEIFTPKETKPDSKPEDPKKNDPPKENPPKKDEPPKTDKTSTGSGGGNTASKPSNFTTPGYDMKIVFEDGLLRVHETTPFGRITLNIPGDLQPGQPFSGTIYLDPAGKNDKERAGNRLGLGELSFRMEDGTIFNVGKLLENKPWDSDIWPWSNNYANWSPAKQAHYRFLSWLSGDTPVCGAELPYQHSVPSQPTSYTIPTGGAQGGFINIYGPFDGSLSKTDFVEIGGQRIPIISESPHSRVVWNTSNNIGSSNISLGENGQTGTCAFNNVSVKLSAPKLHLLRGETTVLTVVVSGLGGLKQDVPFELVNHSPGVVSMAGGNKQSAIIRAGDLQPNGTYTTTRTLTGVAPGSFNITATVQWKETCKPAMEVMRIEKSAPVTNAGAQ